MEELTYDEICILIQAIDAWKNRDINADLMGGLFEAILCDKADESLKQKMEQERMKRDLEKKHKRDKEETKATLLKVKLMIIRDKRFSETIN